MGGVYRKLGGQTLIYGMGNIVPRMLNYAILTFYYTRRFSVEEYGMITELYAYVAILLVILTYGMETGLFRFSSEKKNLSDVFNVSLLSVGGTSLLVIVIVMLVYKRIALWMDYGDHPEYVALLGITVAIDAVTSVIFAKIRMEEKVRKFATIKILNVVVTIVFVMAFLEIMPRIGLLNSWDFYRDNLREFGVGYVFIANLLASFVVLIVLLPDYRHVKFRINRVLLKNLLKYSMPLMIVGLAGQFNDTVERILLRFFLPDQYNVLFEIGIYGANYRIALLMTLFIQMFRYAAEPFFFINYSKKDAKDIYANVLKYFIIFCLIIFLFVTFYLDLIKYFIDKKFYSGLHIVTIILIANLILGVLFNVNMWYKLTGKTYYGIYVTGVGALLTIVLNIIFIPLYSYIACAWIHLISNAVMMIITLILGNKYYKISYDYKRIGEITLVAAGLYMVFILAKSNIVINNIIIGTALLILFLIYCIRREKLISVFFKRENDSKNY